MKKVANEKTSAFRRFFAVDWRAFWVLVKMLFSNSMSINWKKDKKKAIIKIVLSLVAFAAVAALSYVFFYFCIRFSIFSLLAFVPMSVPSIVVTVLLIISFIASLSKVTEELYFGEDNKVLLTLPTNGNTLFLSRLAVRYITSYRRSLLLEIPFLIGYFAVSRYPVYMYFVLFVIWALIDLVMLLLASLISVPVYYIKKAIRTHTWASIIAKSIIFAIILALCITVIVLVPDNIDIFSNWGTYFAKIQNGLNYYKNNLGFFYQISMVYLGNFTGFSFYFMSRSAIAGLWTLLAIIGLIVVLFVASLALASPLYLKLASGTGELQAKGRKNAKEKENKSLPPFISQIKKDAILFFKNSDISSSYLGTFTALPLLIALLAKIFNAMDLNSRGDALVQVVSLLIALLIGLSTNSVIARIYSEEAGAFKLARTYPLKEHYAVGSKLFIPGVFGCLSLVACTISLCYIRPEMLEGTTFMGVAMIFVYVGHLLYSAGLDFTNPSSTFGGGSFLARNENRSVIMAFITSAFFAALYYYYFQDHILWLSSLQATAGFKVFILGVIYLAFNIILYIRKIKYIYKTGEVL